ncbi:MAG: DsbA family protein [Sporichthyaceae bacterium]
MKTQAKVSLVLVAAFALVVGALLALARVTDDSAGAVAGDAAVVRADSHVLGERGSSNVEFVEFLDFECEGCAAAFPVVEQLRKTYAGRITFVARYFPLPGHFNAERAARAAEAAARQGKFEQMYVLMYEKQQQWGEQRVPLDATFRGFAEELGLDMAKYDADYASPEVAARVQRDVQDGTALGVKGTPTFFLNGKRFEPESEADLTNALDEALAGT